MPGSDDETMLRAVVHLVEAQASQIEGLRATVADLEGRLKLRAELDALLSHEVRTPLTVIRGVLQAVHEGVVEGDRRDLLVGRALAQAVHLTEMVDDLMQSVPATASPQARAGLRPVAVTDLVRSSLEAVSPILAPERVVLDVDLDAVVMTAKSRAVAILVNLLQNAARHGGGPVELRAAVVGTELVLEVADRGPGLGGADPEALFTAFTRGHSSPAGPASARRGMGVGLYLVRMLARSLGGEATIADRPGGGAVATVCLPQRRGDDAGVPGDLQAAHLQLVQPSTS